MTTWLTVEQAVEHADRVRSIVSAGQAGCSERTFRSWVARHHLQPAGHDPDGRQLFRLADVATAERNTRARALRLVGIGST